MGSRVRWFLVAAAVACVALPTGRAAAEEVAPPARLFQLRLRISDPGATAARRPRARLAQAAPYEGPSFGGQPIISPEHAAFVYNGNKKDGGVALLLELLCPGVGSIYADHVTGALINWGLEVTGVGLVVWWIASEADSSTYYDMYGAVHERSPSSVPLLLGLAFLLGGRIYGFIDAYEAAQSYNADLRRRLGLSENVAFGVVPLRASGATAYGPAVALRF